MRSLQGDLKRLGKLLGPQEVQRSFFNPQTIDPNNYRINHKIHKHNCKKINHRSENKACNKF